MLRTIAPLPPAGNAVPRLCLSSVLTWDSVCAPARTSPPMSSELPPSTTSIRALKLAASETPIDSTHRMAHDFGTLIALNGNFARATDHTVRDCTPGKTTKLRCSVADDDAAPQVVRICEASAVLGAGVACADADALVAADVEAGAPVTLTFTCPDERDDTEPGGLYALYSGPSFTEDDPSPVSCSVE